MWCTITREQRLPLRRLSITIDRQRLRSEKRQQRRRPDNERGIGNDLRG